MPKDMNETLVPQEKQRAGAIYKVTLVGTLVNLLLSAGKLAAGILGRSGAMVADAVHSISDFATDIVVLLFVKISSKPEDEDHHYGHGKFETLASIIIGLSLFGVAIGIFVNSAQRIAAILDGGVVEGPRLIAIVAAAISIAAKEALYWYTIAVGKKVKSQAVIANAWHHRSDALSSIATLIGISGAYFLGDRWVVLDPLAAIVVAALIVKVSFDLILPGLNELLEKSLSQQEQKKIMQIITDCPHVCDPHHLRTRRIGSCIAVEVHVRLDPEMTVRESHGVTEELERVLRSEYGKETHVIIHVEPLK